MEDLVLRPEHDFIENAEYLNNLASRLDKCDSSNNELIQEIVQADYYVNKLIRRGSSNSDELVVIRDLFEGVLDTVESKKMLSLHRKEEDVEEHFYNDSLFYRIFLITGLVGSVIFTYYVMHFDMLYKLNDFSEKMASYIVQLLGL